MLDTISDGSGLTSGRQLLAKQHDEMDSLFAGTYWHQKWEIFPGVYTPGINDVGLLLSLAQLPRDLAGKRVLDIGAWNGCISFECERRGAEVLAIGPEPAETSGFDKLASLLNSKAKYQLGTVYNLDPNNIGKFDIVICFGVLYHLRHPLLALDMIRRVCTGELYLETACIDVDVRTPSGVITLDQLSPKLKEIPLLQFYRLGELNGDESNWFSFNRKALDGMLQSSGFRPSLFENINDRIIIKSSVIQGPPEWMTIGSGEGVYYDTITRPLLGSSDVY